MKLVINKNEKILKKSAHFLFKIFEVIYKEN